MLDEIDLYLTNKCNLNCDFCSIQARKEMDELTFDQICKVVE